MKVLTFFGTRPEAIKMAPVILELRRYPEDFSVVVVVSAQHRELLDQMLKVFEIEPDYDLDVMTRQQSLSQITTRVLHGIEPILQKEKPDIVLVQGDTTTAFVGALAAFYHKIPIGHVEAGLRTYHKYNPFPEEKNRHLISVLADVHFAPTQRAKENLLQEGIPSHAIHITGNTVVDALLKIICDQKDFHFTAPLLSGLDFEANKILLVTVHRRENLDEPLQSICSALKELVENNGEVRIIFPVHPNPKVYETVHNCLGNIDRIHLIQPLDYISFVHLMSKAYLILTDSGGIQEEAPSLGKPVLVLRQSTERPEGVEAGIIKVVGTNKKDIVETAMVLLNNSDEYSAMVKSTNPYGEGTAASKIVRIITTVVDNRRILCL